MRLPCYDANTGTPTVHDAYSLGFTVESTNQSGLTDTILDSVKLRREGRVPSLRAPTCAQLPVG